MSSTMEAKTRLVLDVSMTMCQATVSVMQNDTARKVVVSLVQDGRPFHIPPGAYVTFQARREIDGEEYPIFDACTVDHVRNAILYDIPGNTTAREGVFEGQFLIMDRDGSTLFCPKMTLVVRQNLFQISVLESAGFSALQGLVEQFRDESGEMDARMDALSDNLDILKDDMKKVAKDLSLTIGEETGDIQLKSGGDVLSQVSLGGLELKLNGKILSLAMVTGAATILLGSCVLDGITGGGNDCKWTETEREQLATVLEHNAYADTEALETAQTLIESLRGGGTQEPAEPEPAYITLTFSLPGAVAVIGGNTIVDGSGYTVEAGTTARQVTVRPVSSDSAAWPSDGAVITVGGDVPSDGQEVTLDGLSCYQFTVVPSADMVVSCTLASLVPEEPWVPVELRVICSLPQTVSFDETYVLYTGAGMKYSTVESLKDCLTVKCTYERTGETKTETVDKAGYTLSSMTYGTGTAAITATDGTDTLTVSFGDLTEQVHLVLTTEDEFESMSISYDTANVHVGEAVSGMFDTIGLVVRMKYQGDVAITSENWASYVSFIDTTEGIDGDREAVSGKQNFEISPVDATEKVVVTVNGCFTVAMTLNGCTSNLPGGLYLGGYTHNFVITPDAGYELEDGDIVIGGAGTYTINENGTATVTLNTMVEDIAVVVNASMVAATHTVTFVADGVTVGTVTFAEGDDSVTEPDVPPKAHYTGAWPSYTLGTADITVEAVYTPITYTITFVDDGGNHAVTYTVLTADTVTAPTVTARDGYTAAWPSWSVGYDNGQTVEAVYTPITLTGITAAYSGGTVAAGTTLDQLTGITVTAAYSDGSTATVASGDYTLSGTLTAGQDNTVTVTYQGKTATFSVTVEAEPATLTGITAAYSGGTVAAGTTLDQLTGITVTATYSDGSTATLAAGDYTLSGTLTAGQDNTVTVAYQGKTATFTVTVEAESAEVTETEIAFTWTGNAKLAYAIGGEATSTVNSSTNYAYAHSQMVPMESGKTYKFVIGKVSALGDKRQWAVRIVFVDDNNIIRASTEEFAKKVDNVTVENIVTGLTCVSGSNVSLATGFYVREYYSSSTGGNVGNPIVNGMTDLTHLYKVG